MRYVLNQASLVAQMVKNLPAMQETCVRSLGREDPLEKGMAIHSSLAWEIPWTEEPGRLQPMGLQKSWTQLITAKQQQQHWLLATQAIARNKKIISPCIKS